MLIVKHSGARDRWPAVACIAGICCGVLVHVSFSILGIATVIAASATLYSTMKLAGAAYLIYVGLKSFLSAGGLKFDQAGKSVISKPGTPFRDGLLLKFPLLFFAAEFVPLPRRMNRNHGRKLR